MTEDTKSGIAAALGRIPSGLFIITAKYEDRRGGMLASWVQQACFAPPMVTVAIAKGRSIMPLISDSRRFGVVVLPHNDKSLMRKFMAQQDVNSDPFVSMDLLPHSLLGLPLPTHGVAVLECELACHMDVEGDHDIFVGSVKAGQSFAGQPAVHLRENGLKY